MLSSFPLKEGILRLIPAADLRKRDSFTAAQILRLAARVSQPAANVQDELVTEWNRFSLADLQVGDDECQLDIAKFWSRQHSSYPALSKLMCTVVCVPHSNASSERVDRYTEQRSELCSDTINSLLSIKMNIDTCCYNTELSPPLLRKLKRAVME